MVFAPLSLLQNLRNKRILNYHDFTRYRIGMQVKVIEVFVGSICSRKPRNRKPRKKRIQSLKQKKTNDASIAANRVRKLWIVILASSFLAVAACSTKENGKESVS